MLSILKRFVRNIWVTIFSRLSYPFLSPKAYTRQQFQATLARARVIYHTNQAGEALIAEYGWCHEFWNEQRRKIGDYLLHDFREGFLSFPTIQGTMVIDGWGAEQWYELSHVLSASDRVKVFLSNFKESRVGQPKIESLRLRVSSSTLRSLYHFARLDRIWKLDAINPLGVIVEVGGGYGNLARILRSALPKTTIVIIDLPEMISIQYLFLTLNLTPEEVVVVSNSDTGIQLHKVNLVPIGLIENVNLEADLFISTQALTETTSEFQQYIVQERNYFSADKVYIVGNFDGPFPNWRSSLLTLKDVLPHVALGSSFDPDSYEFIGWKNLNSSPVPESGVWETSFN